MIQGHDTELPKTVKCSQSQDPQDLSLWRTFSPSIESTWQRISWSCSTLYLLGLCRVDSWCHAHWDTDITGSWADLVRRDTTPEFDAQCPGCLPDAISLHADAHCPSKTSFWCLVKFPLCSLFWLSTVARTPKGLSRVWKYCNRMLIPSKRFVIHRLRQIWNLTELWGIHHNHGSLR